MTMAVTEISMDLGESLIAGRRSPADPGGWGERGQAAVLHHPDDVQVLDYDRAVLGGQRRGELVDRFLSQVRGPMVDAVTCRVGFAPAVGGPLAGAPVRALPARGRPGQ